MRQFCMRQFCLGLLKFRVINPLIARSYLMLLVKLKFLTFKAFKAFKLFTLLAYGLLGLGISLQKIHRLHFGAKQLALEHFI